MMVHEMRILQLPLKIFMAILCRGIDHTVVYWLGRRMNCDTQASVSGAQGGCDLMRCCWMPASHPVSCSIQKIKYTAYLARGCLFPINVVCDCRTSSPTEFSFPT
uniref:Uncharacterized protein n=1 Tax=Mus musculus TaxID=10090 RepID=Q3V0D6_MOUSE|nr:unnamed protein product [Mus musculus]BAE21568.1 unnamed protein product [Mus musculus]